MVKNATEKEVLTLNGWIFKLASSPNAARTAIKAINSYFGATLNGEINEKEFGKLTLKKLAGITGIGPKSFVLLVQAYQAYVTQ